MRLKECNSFILRCSFISIMSKSPCIRMDAFSWSEIGEIITIKPKCNGVLVVYYTGDAKIAQHSFLGDRSRDQICSRFKRQKPIGPFQQSRHIQERDLSLSQTLFEVLATQVYYISHNRRTHKWELTDDKPSKK